MGVLGLHVIFAWRPSNPAYYHPALELGGFLFVAQSSPKIVPKTVRRVPRFFPVIASVAAHA
jgi:hypothetical protein